MPREGRKDMKMNERIEICGKALAKNGFKVFPFETKEEAAAAFLADVSKDETVGFGGSVTTRELGLPEALAARGNTIYSHWETPSGDKKSELRNAMTSDVYVCSANAITENGEIVNIDGTGNRLAALLFGHKRVYIIAGANKLTGSYEEAILRIKNVACPPNAKRLGRKTPCAAVGHCMNCDSPDRLCNATLVLNRKMGGQDYIIYLINEKLGY